MLRVPQCSVCLSAPGKNMTYEEKSIYRKNLAERGQELHGDVGSDDNEMGEPAPPDSEHGDVGEFQWHHRCSLKPMDVLGCRTSATVYEANGHCLFQG